MSERFEDVPLDQIFLDEEFNCRGHISPSSVGELARDIEQNGLLQPIVVQPNPSLGSGGHGKIPVALINPWKIVMGHRRYLATKMLCDRRPDLPRTIKCKVVDALDEEVARVWNIKENLEREKLNMLQEARSLVWFRDRGWEVGRIADKLGQPAQWVKVRLALLDLDEHIQKRAEAGWLNQYQIEEIALLATDQQRHARCREIVHKKMMGEQSQESLLKKKRRKVKALYGRGQPRSVDQVFEVQEHIQDQFQDVKHPAAMALAWAAGVITLEELWEHAETWAADAGLEFKHPEKQAVA